MKEEQRCRKLNGFKLTCSKDAESEGEPVALRWWCGKELVGEILVDTVSAIDGYRWIGNIEVNPKFRGCGLGTQILKHAMDEYKAGALGVRVDNEIALRMYKKVGFEIKGDTFMEGGAEHYRMYYKSNFEEAAALPHIAQQALVSALLGMYDREVYPCEKEQIYNLLYKQICNMVFAEYPILKDFSLQIGDSFFDVWPGWADGRRWRELVETEYADYLQ